MDSIDAKITSGVLVVLSNVSLLAQTAPSIISPKGRVCPSSPCWAAGFVIAVAGISSTEDAANRSTFPKTPRATPARIPWIWNSLQ
ncbi:jg19821 [Pararge aegeria aegeria]|uniref:Jg19821 protein n=1 Tax=Pararge aegeria aegeria TaxID=348720 RepID=A0A8S4SJ94_9NEOP|nr:jg19821 [Pararge aegeria aegeria]